MDDRKEILDLLQDLVQTCRDGQEGYRNAALHIQDPELHRYFDEQSLERARFAGEIEEEVQRLGKPDPKRTGTVAGSIHRAWINLKAGLGGGDLAILSAVEAVQKGPSLPRLGLFFRRRSWKSAVPDKLPAFAAYGIGRGRFG
jgi:uncharacterized protein (TIGR02284 family)